MKEFSRLAGQLGFEYHVIEGFWSRWSDQQIREIVEYSKQQGVRLLFWKHSNQLHTPQASTESQKAFYKTERKNILFANLILPHLER